MTYSIRKNRFILAAKRALIWQKNTTLGSSFSSSLASSQTRNSSQFSLSRGVIIAALSMMSTASYSEMILDPISDERGRSVAGLSFRCTHDVATQDLSSVQMRWSSDQPLGTSHAVNSVSNGVGDEVATVRIHSSNGLTDIPVTDYSIVAKPFDELFQITEVALNLNLAGVLPPLATQDIVEVLFDTPSNEFVSNAPQDDKAIYHAVGRNMIMLQNTCSERGEEGGAQDRIVFKELPIAPPRITNFDGDTGLLTVYGVNAGGKLYDIFLTQTSFSHFSLRNFEPHTGSAPESISTYNASTLTLDLPQVKAFGGTFRVVLKNNGNFEFDITTADAL